MSNPANNLNFTSYLLFAIIYANSPCSDQGLVLVILMSTNFP